MFGGETLNCSQSFTTIPLLNPNVSHTVLNGTFVTLGSIGEGFGFIYLSLGHFLEFSLRCKTDEDSTVSLELLIHRKN